MVQGKRSPAGLALDVAASYGFALAGGNAVQAHGFLDRPSADVDLFAEASVQFDFSQAVDAVIAAYRRDGLQADAEVRSSTFARLSVSVGEERAKVELGVDWPKNEPILVAIGPVLHADDAVAYKVCALFGRAEVRDYVDVAAILASGRYSKEDLVRLAEEHDPGFDPSWLAASRTCSCQAIALCSTMSTRSSPRAKVRPRRFQAPCPEETVGSICQHASPPRHLKFLRAVRVYKSGSPPESLFPPDPAPLPPSSYTGVTGVRNRVRISWRCRMETGSVRVPSVIDVGIA